MKNCRVFNSADIGSDHALLMSTCRFETLDKKRVKCPNRKYDVDKLQVPRISQEFQKKIGGSFEPLLNLKTDIDDLYDQFRTLTNSAMEDTVGFKPRKPVEGMNEELRTFCQDRRKARVC